MIRRWMPIVFLFALAAGGPACEKKAKPCGDGLELDEARSNDEQMWCKSPDGRRARWIEFHPGGKQRRQSCGYANGRPEGSYLAWHPNGRMWVEGVYKDGRKIRKWTQYSDTGGLVARGEYRFGRFVAGAPVGSQASCEKQKP